MATPAPVAGAFSAPASRSYDLVEAELQGEVCCPITSEIMLDPHLTTCCGNNLSAQAVRKLQRDKKPCPFCKKSPSEWSSVLDKKHQRFVRALRVRCPQKSDGCNWEGELNSLEQHEKLHLQSLAHGVNITPAMDKSAKSLRKAAPPPPAILQFSKRLNKKSNIYQIILCYDHKHINKQHRIARHYVGPKVRGIQSVEKVIMMVGVTGAGKTTLINGMVNYLFGIQWNDQFRLKLVVESSATQTCSQTKWITAYTINPIKGFPLQFTVTIIDTPGFGDTAGLKRDKEITEQIKQFFSTHVAEGGISHIDAIAFVTQASQPRLTPTQTYVFDSILSTFGEDVKGNIFILFTFADGKKPVAIDAVKKADIPFLQYFKFNNSSLYAGFEDEGGDTEKESENKFDTMYWELGMQSFKDFFQHFAKLESKSLQLTREVLQERHRLEMAVGDIQHQITVGLSKIDTLNQEKSVLQDHEAHLHANKRFTYRIKVVNQRKVDLPTGTHVTNCLVCNHTCHVDCMIPKDEEKHGCWAMDNGGKSSASCRICPGHCFWNKHVNNPYRFEFYDDWITQTSEDLKEKYYKAKKGKSRAESMILTLQQTLDNVDRYVMTLIREVKESLARLDEIALKPNPLTEVEYIDLLIQSEKLEAKPGWLQRIQYLESARKEASITCGLKKTPQDALNKLKRERQSLWLSIKGWWES